MDLVSTSSQSLVHIIGLRLHVCFQWGEIEYVIDDHSAPLARNQTSRILVRNRVRMQHPEPRNMLIWPLQAHALAHSCTHAAFHLTLCPLLPKGVVTRGPLKGFGVEVVGVRDVAYVCRIAGVPDGATDFAEALELRVGDERLVRRTDIAREGTAEGDGVRADVSELAVNAYGRPVFATAARERRRALRLAGGPAPSTAPLERVAHDYVNSSGVEIAVVDAPGGRVTGERIAPGEGMGVRGLRGAWGKLGPRRWAPCSDCSGSGEKSPNLKERAVLQPAHGEQPAPQLPGEHDAEAEELDALAALAVAQREAEDKARAAEWLTAAREDDEARRAAAREAGSPEAAAAFLPGGLPSLYTGSDDAYTDFCAAVREGAFFPPVADGLLASASLDALTDACRTLCEAAADAERPPADVLASMRPAERDALEKSLPVVPWRGGADFPFNEPDKFKWLEEYLYEVALPVAFECSNSDDMPFNAAARARAWNAARAPPAGRTRLLLGRVPAAHRAAGGPELARFEAIVTGLERVCGVDCYGNVVCPFAQPFAAGDFEFKAFLPHERGGPAAAEARNCVVEARRIAEWRGLKLPHLVPQEHLLCGLTLAKLLNAAASGARASRHPNGARAAANALELLLGYVPTGNPAQINLRADIPDPLIGFSSAAAAADFLEELHELCEPTDGGVGVSLLLAQRPRRGLRPKFHDASPRDAFAREEWCFMCRGEQAFYCLPCSLQDLEQECAHGDLEALDPLRKMAPRLCSNCVFLSVEWKGPALGMGGRARDLASATARRQERKNAAAEKARRARAGEREAARAGHGHRLGEATADAHEMVADLRARGCHADADELQAEIDYESDQDDGVMGAHARGEILDVF